MSSHALTSFARSLTRHRLHAALNIGGLAIGIAVFTVLMLYVRFETSYDKWIPGWRNVRIVETRWSYADSPVTGVFPDTMGGLLDQMREDFPGLRGTRIRAIGANVIRGGIGTSEDFAQVDPEFLSILPMRIVRGVPRGALADPTALFIDETMAAKYSPGGDPIGRQLTLNADGQTGRYHVVAVYADPPKATELPSMTMFARLPQSLAASKDNWYHWGSTTLNTYLRFDNPEAETAVAAGLEPFVDRRARKDVGPDAWHSISLKLLPVADLHLQPPAKRLTVTTLGLIGALTLFIAIVNYVNLATARAGLRAREVAMRKVLGADRGALVRQFLGEAVATVAVATLLGLALAELALPLVNAAGGLTLTIPYGPVVVAGVAFAILIGTAAGVYPALLLSNFPIADVLASARAPGGGRAGTRVREALVFLQFALVIAFLAGAFVLVAQTRHVRRTDLGYARDGLIELKSVSEPALSDGRRRTIVDAVRAMPGVRSVGVADLAAGEDSTNNANNIVLPGKAGDGPSLKMVIVGPDFFRTYGTRPLAGRLFDAAHGLDDIGSRKPEEARNIVINEKAVPVLGFRSPADAIGRTVGGKTPRTIVGVVPDLRYFSPRRPVAPTYYLFTSGMPSTAQFASVRFDGDPKAMLAALRARWLQLAPEVPFDAKLATTSLGNYYRDDDHATNLFAIGAVLAVAIGCIGLWGLASFTTARRVKEIGIRKTLGASTARSCACWSASSCARCCSPTCSPGRWRSRPCASGSPASTIGSRSPRSICSPRASPLH